jgi:hypothetical protein
MREIVTEIEIDAPPERVWSVLSDFGSFGEWNPFIPAIEGEAKVGSRLAVTIQPPGGKRMTFKPTVLNADPDRELRWLGRVVVPGLADGEHVLGLEPLAVERTRFVQREEFRGPLWLLLGGTLKKTEHGFVAMNEALKRRVEGGGQPT